MEKFIHGISEVLLIFCCIGIIVHLLDKKHKRINLLIFLLCSCSIGIRLLIGAGSSRYYIFFIIPAIIFSVSTIEKLSYFPFKNNKTLHIVIRCIICVFFILPIFLSVIHLLRFNRYSNYLQRIGEMIYEDAKNYKGSRIRLLCDSNLYRIQYYSKINDGTFLRNDDNSLCKTPDQCKKKIISLQGTPGIYYVVIKSKSNDEPISYDFLELSPEEWVHVSSFYSNNRMKDIYRLYRFHAHKIIWGTISSNICSNNLITDGNFENLSVENNRTNFFANDSLLVYDPNICLDQKNTIIIEHPGINGNFGIHCLAPANLSYKAKVLPKEYTFKMNISAFRASKISFLLFIHNKIYKRIAKIRYADIEIPEKKSFQFQGEIDLKKYDHAHQLILFIHITDGDVMFDDFCLSQKNNI